MSLVNNNSNAEITSHVKFVSYTGSYPNLCRGVLTLAIDGQEYKFGHDDYRLDDGNFDEFWSSGGGCGFSNDYSDSYVEQGEWEIDVEELPEQFRKYAAEIDIEFNSNVPYGCCGGCL